MLRWFRYNMLVNIYELLIMAMHNLSQRLFFKTSHMCQRFHRVDLDAMFGGRTTWSDSHGFGSLGSARGGQRRVFALHE